MLHVGEGGRGCCMWGKEVGDAACGARRRKGDGSGAGVGCRWYGRGSVLRVRLDKYFELKVILQDTRSGMTVTKGCTNFCAVLV